MENAQHKPAGSPADLDFEELFASEVNKGQAQADAPEENLDELEAFLDSFEKNLDGEPAKAGTPMPEPAPVASAAPAVAPTADFTQPDHAEELVHGLLKDDDFNLDVGDAEPVAGMPAAKPAGAPSAAPVPAVDEFEPEPVAPAVITPAPVTPMRGDAPAAPAFIEAAPAPAGASDSPRSLSLPLAAMALAGVSLLVSIAAAYLSVGTRPSTSPPVATAGVPEARIVALQQEVTALKQRLDQVALALDGPVAHLADALPRDVESLQGRLGELQVQVSALESRLATVPAPKTVATAAPAVVPARADVPAQSGGWVVNLESFTERGAAEQELARVRAKGVQASVHQAEMGGRTWYRVVVGGFDSADAARAYMNGPAKQHGFGKAWIGKR